LAQAFGSRWAQQATAGWGLAAWAVTAGRAMHQMSPPPLHPPTPVGGGGHAATVQRAANAYGGAGAESSGGATCAAAAALQVVETDMTVQAFSQWLTEMKVRNTRTQQEMLSEMSIIRDGIASNNMDLTDLKRHSMGVSQQMQCQLTDLREKLTNAFAEITALVRQKTTADQELMQDIHGLQSNLSSKTAELEALKRSYSQAHQQLQSCLIQIQNHLGVTATEVKSALGCCERVQHLTTHRLGEMGGNLRGLEDLLSVANAEHKDQMKQLHEEIARIHESLASVSHEFVEHKRSTNSVQNMLQSQVWGLEDGQRRQQPVATSPFGVGGGGGGGGSAAVPATLLARKTSYEPPLALPPQDMQDYVAIGTVQVPLYADHHLRTLHPAVLREHAAVLYRTLGHERIGCGLPSTEAELMAWVASVQRAHLEPMRAASAPSGSSMGLAAAGRGPAMVEQQLVVADSAGGGGGGGGCGLPQRSLAPAALGLAGLPMTAPANVPMQRPGAMEHTASRQTLLQPAAPAAAGSVAVVGATSMAPMVVSALPAPTTSSLMPAMAVALPPASGGGGARIPVFAAGGGR